MSLRDVLGRMKEALPAADAGPDPEFLRWRVRALDLVLWTSLSLGGAVLLLLFLVVPEAAPLGKRLLGLGAFLAIGMVALARSVPHPVRAWGFLLIVLLLAGVTLAARGLEGSGRLFLAVVPLLATVLVGRRSGYVSAVMSLALFLGAASLTTGGSWAPLPSWPEAAARFWLFQGGVLLVVQWPVLVLIDRFIGQLQEVLAAERKADRERRRLERELLESAEIERREIGHRLHDGACQGITAAALRCQLVKSSLAARGSREEVAHLEAVAALLEESLKEIHDLARGLSPPVLSPEAFPAALDDLAEGVRSSTGIECDLLHDGLVRPEDPERSTHLFWIAREAVSNALRHGRPRRIEIELARGGGALTLRVQDDGAGIPENGAPGGMGLGVMMQRAERMGGTLTVGPGVSGGTAVTCTVPLLRTAGDREGDR